MVMKDITAVDDIERAVRADPERIDEAADRIERQLADDDRDERLDAGRALRAAAEHDPALVAPFRETLVELLGAEEGPLRLAGAVGVAGLTTVDPDPLVDAVPRLVATLEEAVAPTIAEATIRALANIGTVDAAAVADADPVVGARLSEATLPVKLAAMKLFVEPVAAAPGRFPETVAAYETLLAEESDARARFAAEALATVGEADPMALESPDAVLQRVEELEAQVDADPRADVGEDIKRAARTLRDLDTAGV